jgi:alpha-tubulin suppressor-like RCC1 family protein
MKTLLQQRFTIIICLLLTGMLNVNGQVSRTKQKSTIVYKGDHQRVSAGTHALEIRKGTLWAWGFNNSGQLGDGTTTQKTSPVQIGTDNKWVTVAAGQVHSVGIKSNGTLWAWGNNSFGQLGDGTTTQRNSPTQIGTDNKWVSIAAGQSFTLALKSDGTLWAWGDNSNGQLGDGTTTYKLSPTQIGTDNKWISIAAGRHFISCNKI